MAEGSKTSFGYEKLELLGKGFKKAFDTVKDNYALIIVDDRGTDANILMNGRIRHDFKCGEPGKLVVLTVVAALQSIGRCSTKVYTNSYSDNIQAIIEWISNPNTRQGDLIVSIDLMSGFEFFIILDLTGGDTTVVTRTLANVLTIVSNSVLDQQWAIQNIIKPDHDCSTIMEWTSTRARISCDVTMLLGEIGNLYKQCL